MGAMRQDMTAKPTPAQLSICDPAIPPRKPSTGAMTEMVPKMGFRFRMMDEMA
jgi:hypothetical protein